MGQVSHFVKEQEEVNLYRIQLIFILLGAIHAQTSISVVYCIFENNIGTELGNDIYLYFGVLN
jgi:hypothetical protein